MPTFRARLRRLGPLYGVDVPATVVRALGGAKKIPVTVRYLGDVHASTVTPARTGGGRLFLRVEVFRPHGIGVGDELEITLTADRTIRTVVTPPDLALALRYRPAAAEGWARAAPSTRRVVVENLDAARAPETRARRIEKLVEYYAERFAARARKNPRPPP